MRKGKTKRIGIEILKQAVGITMVFIVLAPILLTLFASLKTHHHCCFLSFPELLLITLKKYLPINIFCWDLRIQELFW